MNNNGFVYLEVLQEQQSNRIKSFVKANCWGIFSEGKSKFKKGTAMQLTKSQPGENGMFYFYNLLSAKEKDLLRHVYHLVFYVMLWV